MLAFLVLVTVALSSAHHSGEHYEGEKVFRVNVEDENQINLLHELASTKQIDFWKPDSVTQIKPHSTVDFRVKAEDILSVEDFLEQNELQYKVLISNLRSVLEAQFDSQVRATGHSYMKYNNWETIEAWTEQVTSENPDLISRSTIGTTFEGRTMYLLKVGKAGLNKPAIFMDCGFHAREWISPAFCQWFVREAVRTYGREIHMTELLDKLDFYVLPVVNIDGYVYTWTKNRMWRKTRSTHAGSTCIGTDPNRNFDAGWCSIGASENPCDETYCGPTAESEKETKALADFIRNNLSSIRAYLTIHSYSQMMLYPYSYAYKLVENNIELNTLAKATVKELATLHGTKYTYGPGATTIYPAAGGSDDWAYDQGVKYSFTFELRDKGRYGFALPESQIQPTCEETMLAIKILIHDLQKEIEKQFDVKEDIPGKHSYAKYNNWNKMVAWMDKMVQKHPEMVSRIKIGTTVEDNPLYVLKATKTYGKNKIMTKLRDQMNFYVLPVFNVEGYVWSWTQAKVAKIGTDVLSTRYESHYIYGPIPRTIYPTSDFSLDWAYNLAIKHTFALELRDKGKFSFLLPESRMKSTCKETMLAVQLIAKYILKHTS